MVTWSPEETCGINLRPRPRQSQRPGDEGGRPCPCWAARGLRHQVLGRTHDSTGPASEHCSQTTSPKAESAQKDTTAASSVPAPAFAEAPGGCNSLHPLDPDFPTGEVQSQRLLGGREGAKQLSRAWEKLAPLLMVSV